MMPPIEIVAVPGTPDNYGYLIILHSDGTISRRFFDGSGIQWIIASEDGVLVDKVVK